MNTFGKKPHSRYNTARKVLIFWCLFIGIGACVGGTAMLLQPDGSLLHMQGMLPYFQKLPYAALLFQDYVFSGIALLCVNGATNLVAAVLLCMGKRAGVVCGTVFGCTLMLWICIQFYLFPANFLSTSYFFFGLLQAVCGYAAWVFYQQEQFALCEADYPQIGTNSQELVVYFSRMGYTKRVALAHANRLGAEVYEISTPEPTAGTGGFWWCGFFAMRRRPMPINAIPLDLTRYAHVTLCAPIWVFGLCSPMLAFCQAAKGKLRAVSYVLLHHTSHRYAHVVAHMDALLGVQHTAALSLRCFLGKTRCVWRD